MRRHCCRWRTVADCCWGQLSTVRLRRLRCAWCRARRLARRNGWSCSGRRLKSAISRRVPELKSGKIDSDSFRLCFSEADEIPGLIVDKYGELVIVQLLAKGLDSAAVRQKIVATIQELIKPASILERPDPRIRELEGLSAPSLEPLYAADPKNPLTATQFRLNGLTFHYDANAGQKTGAFLDQHANYKAAQDWAWMLAPGGRALDVCTYQGGFALHLAQGFEARDRDRCFARFAGSGGTESGGQSRPTQRRGGLGGGRCVRNSARLVIGA